MEWQIYRALGVYEHKNNVREHFYCVKQIFELYKTKEQLENLASRPDIDTVCAFDYFRMTCIKTKFNLQKLVHSSMEMYNNDEEFRSFHRKNIKSQALFLARSE